MPIMTPQRARIIQHVLDGGANPGTHRTTDYLKWRKNLTEENKLLKEIYAEDSRNAKLKAKADLMKDYVRSGPEAELRRLQGAGYVKGSAYVQGFISMVKSGAGGAQINRLMHRYYPEYLKSVGVASVPKLNIKPGLGGPPSSVTGPDASSLVGIGPKVSDVTLAHPAKNRPVQKLKIKTRQKVSGALPVGIHYGRGVDWNNTLASAIESNPGLLGRIGISPGDSKISIAAHEFTHGALGRAINMDKYNKFVDSLAASGRYSATMHEAMPLITDAPQVPGAAGKFKGSNLTSRELGAAKKFEEQVHDWGGYAAEVEADDAGKGFEQWITAKYPEAAARINSLMRRQLYHGPSTDSRQYELDQLAKSSTAYQQGFASMVKSGAAAWERNILKLWPSFSKGDKLKTLNHLSDRVRDAYRPVMNGNVVSGRQANGASAEWTPSLIELAKENPDKLSAKNIRRLILGSRRASRATSIAPEVDGMSATLPEINQKAVRLGRGDAGMALKAKRLLMRNPSEAHAPNTVMSDFIRPAEGVGEGIQSGENLSARNFMKDVMAGTSAGARAEAKSLGSVWWNQRSPGSGASVNLHPSMVSRYSGSAPYHGDVPAISTAKLNTAKVQGRGNFKSVEGQSDFSQMVGGAPAITEFGSVALPRTVLKDTGPEMNSLVRRVPKDPARRNKLEEKIRTMSNKAFDLNYKNLGDVAREDVIRRIAIPHLGENIVSATYMQGFMKKVAEAIDRTKTLSVLKPSILYNKPSLRARMKKKSQATPWTDMRPQPNKQAQGPSNGEPNPPPEKYHKKTKMQKYLGRK